MDPQNNYRYYNITHAERIIVSRRFRNLGFSIGETKELINSKNGTEIHAMLQNQHSSIQEQIKQLERQKGHLESLMHVCSEFNQVPETYEITMRPGYYYYHQTQHINFIEENMNEQLIKEIMQQWPNAFKLMLVPYSKLINPDNKTYYHTLAIKENEAADISLEYLQQMTYLPPRQAVNENGDAIANLFVAGADAAANVSTAK